MQVKEKASAAVKTGAETAPPRAWHDIILQTLKRNEVKLVPYVPDRVFTPLIEALHLATDEESDRA